MSDRVRGDGQRDGLPSRGTGRRRSLIFLIFLLVGLPLAFLIRAATDQGWRQITTVRALEARGVIYLPEVRVFLVHAALPLALSAVSSHVGEPIAYCPSSETFMELAHGSKWDRSGYYLDGPAPRGMDRVGSRVREEIIEVNTSIVKRGPPRGAGPPAKPTGPLCVFERASDASDGFVKPVPVSG